MQDVDYSQEKLIHELFLEQANTIPESTAVVFNSKNVSYKELNEESNKLANYLVRECSIRPGKFVAIFMERSEKVIIAMLGVLKAGGGYVPIEPHTPEMRVKTILDEAEVETVITSKNHISTLNKLQWECKSFCTYIAMDTSDPYQLDSDYQEKISEVEKLWDFVSGEKDYSEYGGFVNSYTGKALSLQELEEYVQNTVKKLKPHIDKSQTLLEIGCGSGLIARAIAPLVHSYYGIDISQAPIEKTKQELINRKIENFKLICLAADELEKLDRKFDIIVLNSVIQYFPSYNYLRLVINKAISQLTDQGIIFIADIRDQDLKSEFLNSLEEYKRNRPEASVVISNSYIDELFIARDFFENLKSEWKEIREVISTNKIAVIENELTKYRYDTMLIIDKLNGVTSSSKKKVKRQLGCDVLKDITEPFCQVKSSDPAYVIFTSGSSGKPKGVIVLHRNVINLITGISRELGFSKGKTIVSVTTVAFDIFVVEIIVSLIRGMKIVLANEEQQMVPKELNKLIRDNKVDIIQTTPSRIEMILQDGDSSTCLKELKEIIIGGEVFHKRLLERLNKICTGKIYNVYGPTETTVWSTLQEVTGKVNIDIGKPIANTQIYIVKEDHLADIGEEGELCIAGNGVAMGYLNDQRLTELKFVDNPFTKEGKMYRTGDMARWLPDGNIQFINRIDDQVKVRGYRIELDEIKTILLMNEEIENAAVIVRPDEHDIQEIYCYLVSKKTVDIIQVKEMLARFLPYYMIPQYIMQIEKIPLNPNGKIDKKALPYIKNISHLKYVPAQTPKEELLCKAFAQVLGLKEIGIHDNFYELGGNSIRAIRLISYLQKRDYNLIFADILKYQTVENLAKRLSGNDNLTDVIKMPLPMEKTGIYNKEIIYNEEEFMKSVDNHVIQYMKSIMKNELQLISELSAPQIMSFYTGVKSSHMKIKVDRKMDIDRIKKTWLHLLQEYTVLSSSVVINGVVNEMREYAADKSFYMPVVDLSQYSPSQRQMLYKKLIEYAIDYFDKDQYQGDTLSSFAICIHLEQEQQIILLSVSHLIFDEQSSKLIKLRFEELYDSADELEVEPYRYNDYTSIIDQGPIGVTEDKIIEGLDLKRYEKYFDEYMLYKKEREFSYIKYRLDLKNYKLTEEEKINLTDKIVKEAMKFSFDGIKIPITVALMGRQYGKNYFLKYVGLFIDMLPVILNVNDEMNIFHKIQDYCDFLKEYNIHIISIMGRSDLRDKYKNLNTILSVIQKVNYYHSSFPMMNHLLDYDVDEISLKNEKEHAQEGATLTIMQLRNELLFEHFECIKGKEKELAAHLNNVAENYISCIL